MVREEYEFIDIGEYLYNTNDLLIVGNPNSEERSSFFYRNWMDRNKDILLFCHSQSDNIIYKYFSKGSFQESQTVDLSIGIPRILKDLSVGQKNIILDLSSLDHVLIMYLTKLLVCQIVPKTFFATYIRPEQYHYQSGNIDFSLCDQVSGIKSVPGFAKRDKNIQTLCSFVGFEGVRLKSIFEVVHNVQKFIPIVAFPSGEPQWYNVTMWNGMDVFQSDIQNITLQKCFSESIFEAVDLLRSCLSLDEKIVLAPLGTRPHSMASAIFACNHPNTRIIYDYVVEREQRAKGIAHILVYHLSSFLSIL